MTGPYERDCPHEVQAVAWALHALEPDEELEFLQHLHDCADCQAVVADAEQVSAGLGASVEQVDPPPALRGELLARVARTPQQHSRGADDAPEPARAAPPPPPVDRPVERPGERPRERFSRRSRQLAVAALALVAVLGVGGVVARNAQSGQQPDPGTSQAQRVPDVLDDIARPGTPHALLSTEDGATVAAVVIEDGRRQIVAVGMPPNPADRSTYVLWGIPAEGAPQPLGTFDVAGTDTTPRPVGSGGATDRFTAYAISLESGRTAPAAPSAVMAKGEVAT